MRAVITLTVPGTSSAGRARFRPWRCHVVHAPWKPGASQSRRPGSAARQVDAGHADLGESQLMRPLPQLRTSNCARRSVMTLDACADSRNPHPHVARRGRLRRLRRARWPAQPALRDAFIELHGALGAGKTTFVRHLLRALGVHGPHQEPDLRRAGALRAARAGRSRTSTSTASTTRASGRTPAFARSSPRRA